MILVVEIEKPSTYFDIQNYQLYIRNIITNAFNGY